MKKYLVLLLLMMFCVPTNDLLFVSYMGWYDKNSYTIGWQEVTSKECILDGKSITAIADKIKKENKFYKVIILNFQRFEGQGKL